MGNAGGTYLFPVPNFNDPLDMVTDLSKLAQAVDTALWNSTLTPLGMQSVSTMSISGYTEAGLAEITAGSGIVPIEGKRQGDLVSISIAAKYNKSFNLPANGDITNTSLFTVDTVAERPKVDVPFKMINAVTGLTGYGLLQTTGVCLWTVVHSYSTSTTTIAIATGTIWYGDIVYCLAA